MMTDDNERFNQVMKMILDDVMMEGEIMADRTIQAPAILALCQALTLQLPQITDQLRTKFAATEGDDPNQYVTEALQNMIHLAFDYGFRTGRIFEARDYKVNVPGEHNW